ncbi:MAG: hypothetical protein QOE76_4350 [Frankiales bacterium]|nr:hypothetical protein [Frankiales bacterium]
MSTSSGTHTAGIALMVVAGLCVGGAWSLFTRQPRTTGFLVAALVVAIVAVALFFSGVTRVG